MCYQFLSFSSVLTRRDQHREEDNPKGISGLYTITSFMESLSSKERTLTKYYT